MAQYAAPGRDGTYIDDPGRENPTYNETESLMMIHEMENKDDEDNPFRPPPEDEEQPIDDLDPQDPFHDDPLDDPSVDEGVKDVHPEQPLGDNKARDSDDISDDDSDDLYFEEDREAMEKDQEQKDQEQRDPSHGSDEEDPTYFKDEGTFEDGRREWKYSTANIKQRGIWVKWCCIALFFLLCLLIFAAISVLFEKLFFDNEGLDPETAYPKRPDNDTFPSNKELIDAVCSSGTLDMDRGVRCREFCEPMHSSCCEVFPYETYNYSSVNAALNATPPPTFILEDDDIFHLNTCEFGDHLRGCAAYGKCSALKNLLDPAPATLPYLCSEEGLAQDEQTCPDACRKVACCFDESGLSCLNDNFDVCMDYAPCQNLRKPLNPDRHIVPVAPDDIDRVCYWKLPQCYEYCEQARCCMDPNSRCLQENFLACLSYAACEDSTDVNITVPPMYSVVPQAPAELIYACGEREPENEEVIELIQPESCPEYCEQVACCYQHNPADNCFHKDPLGCLAWHNFCQTEEVAVSNWYIGNFILPTPP